MDRENRCLNCMETIDESRKCNNCGWEIGSEPESSLHLKQGTILNGKYLIGRVLGQGGFGITYLAYDLMLDIKLAIKEYFPHGLASRAIGTSVLSVFSGDKKDQYEYGLDKFFEEAKKLARFNEVEGVVTVRDIFRENETAYVVMEYIEGITLKEYVEKSGGKLPIDMAMNIMLPVMQALEKVHQKGILHRDVSPDNIYITKDLKVKLLDFGAARYAVGEQSRSLSVILKPGYAPEEQYRTRGKQGPWTDVYAVAATLYHVITGVVPPESLERIEEDTLVLPSQMGVDLPKHVELALAKALEVRGVNRFETIRTFKVSLENDQEIDSMKILNKNSTDDRVNPRLSDKTGSEIKAEESSIDKQYAHKQNFNKKLGLIFGFAVVLIIILLIRLFNNGDDQNTNLVKENLSIDNTEENQKDKRSYNKEDESNILDKDDNEADTNTPVIVEISPEEEYLKGCAEEKAENYIQAVYYYRKAAKQGYADAQTSLAICYANGRGVQKDYEQAVYWYTLAAEQGHSTAQYNLGYCYYNGEGVEQDYEQAVYWYTLAAEQGHSRAQTILAKENGKDSASEANNESEKVTLTILVGMETYNKSYMKRAWENYEKATGNKLEIEAVSDVAREEIMQIKFATGDIPDILMHFPGHVLAPFIPEENFLDMSNEPWVKDISDIVLNQTKYNGKIYGLPHWEASITGMIYNKEIFGDLGIDIPTNQDEFNAACERIKNAGINPVYIAFKDVWPIFPQPALSKLFYEQPELLEKLNTNQITFSDLPEFINMLEWYKMMADNGYYGERFTTNTWDGGSAALAEGQYAMMLSSDAWVYTVLLQKYPEMEDKIGIMPIFQGVSEEGYFEGPNVNLTLVNKNSKNVEAAKEYVEFLAKPENLNYTFKDFSTVPTFKTMTENKPGGLYLDAQGLIDQYGVPSIAWPEIIGYSGFEGVRPIQELMIGAISVEEAAKAIDNERIKSARAQKVSGF